MPSPAVFPLLGFYSCLVSPWAWIARKGAMASAWGSTPIEEAGASTRPVSEELMVCMHGPEAAFRVAMAIGLLVLVTATALAFPLGGLMIAFSCLPLLVIVFAHRRLGKEVEAGFLAVFFLQSAVLSVIIAAVVEQITVVLWTLSFPECHLGFPTHAVRHGKLKHVSDITLTPECEITSWTAFVCIPGIVEETLKILWVFYRLRRSTNDVPERCCFGFCAVESGQRDCGWWFKLAETPQHVLLGAMAAGAGFEVAENFTYAFSAGSAAAGVFTSLVRGVLPLHICWTGMIGVELARRMFWPRSKSPSLLLVLLPPMCLHGSMDFLLTAMASVALAAPKDEDDPENAVIGAWELLIFVCLLAVLLVSVLRLCYATGLRCCISPRSCCCNREYWEHEFPLSSINVGNEASSAIVGEPVAMRQPLLPQPH